jgi:hypothetical protein
MCVQVDRSFPWMGVWVPMDNIWRCRALMQGRVKSCKVVIICGSQRGLESHREAMIHT